MALWKPLQGCKFCYNHKGDAKRNVDTSCIAKADNIYAPTERMKNGKFKMKPDLMYACLSSNFLPE